jgi:class 3 adenylate cyclase
VQRRTCTWHFDSPAEKIWPVLADSARFNEAARLEGQSRGGDIVMSREFADDPGIAPLLGAFSPGEATAEPKGFPEPVPFLRISAEKLAAKAGD